MEGKGEGRGEGKRGGIFHASLSSYSIPLYSSLHNKTQHKKAADEEAIYLCLIEKDRGIDGE